MVKQHWRDEDWGGLILFCNIPGPGACFCALNVERTNNAGDCAVVDCDSDYDPRCWRRAVIAPSLENWLQRAFDAALQDGDPYYWLNRPGLPALYRECAEEGRRLVEEWRRLRSLGVDAPPPGPITNGEQRFVSIEVTRHAVRYRQVPEEPQ